MRCKLYLSSFCKIKKQNLSTTMASLQSKKPQLPRSVLDMKFMRKTKERIEKELDNIQDHESLYSNLVTNEMRHASGNFISESSYIFCEELLEGRLSFKGMNPEIERLMELNNSKHEKDDGEMGKDVSDEVLAKTMKAFHKRKRNNETPIKTIAKKKK